jgi:hypothetical protein
MGLQHGRNPALGAPGFGETDHAGELILTTVKAPKHSHQACDHRGPRGQRPLSACQNREHSEPPQEPQSDAFPALTTRRQSLRGIRESDDAYPVLVHISDKLRVIECRDGIQWILQTRSDNRWRDLGYHRDRDVLIERCGPISRQALAVLKALPRIKP